MRSRSCAALGTALRVTLVLAAGLGWLAASPITAAADGGCHQGCHQRDRDDHRRHCDGCGCNGNCNGCNGCNGNCGCGNCSGCNGGCNGCFNSNCNFFNTSFSSFGFLPPVSSLPVTSSPAPAMTTPTPAATAMPQKVVAPKLPPPPPMMAPSPAPSTSTGVTGTNRTGTTGSGSSGASYRASGASASSTRLVGSVAAEPGSRQKAGSGSVPERLAGSPGLLAALLAAVLVALGAVVWRGRRSAAQG